MPTLPLPEDAFRLLAYVRAYADRREQHLDPSWVRQQLEFSPGQLRDAGRELSSRGLAEFFEWQPDDETMIPAEFGDGPIPMDIQLTYAGWDYLRRNA